LDLDLPKAGTVLEPRTAIVSLVVGVSVTMLASVIPAIRATRVPAVAALREGAVLPKSRGQLGKVAAVGLTLFGAAALAQATLGGGSAGSVLMLLGVGVIALFIGIALVSPRLVRPLARIVGAPSRALGGTPGRLASENSVRNPGRTAATAAALMIGLALVTVVATVGNGLRNSDKAAIAGTIHSDRVVTAKNGFDPIPTNAGRALASVPGVAAVSAVRTDKARAAGATVDVNGVDPATITSLAHLRWSAGSDATLRGLGDDGVVVKRRFAKDHHLTVGSRVTVVSPTGIRRAYTVRGIVDPPAFDQVDAVFGELMITQRAFDQAFPRPKDAFTLVDLAPRAGASTERAMRTALAPYPDTKVSTKDAYVQDRANGVNKLLNLLYVLLALSVLVSLFGMINTLVLSTFERTRELGMLRAIGMTRRQVRRMVRHESIVTALIGAALGIGVGLGLSALVTRALAGQGLVFQVPTGSLVAFVVVAIGAGVLAAVLPARRAGRLDVLAALKYE
ncbi:MAG TPA: FtsX-like permease family protein, partial [Miltoncostaeaceae bacterium]|nr:FtsX-like permease family protein [Miltoncostaeaceae bacterium]